MSEFTEMRDAVAAGERLEAAAILPLVYDELRKLASAKMAAENPGHTLDATAIVHEAYARLTRRRSFASESHFLRAAAQSMRRILVDHARSRNAAKRGRSRRVDFDPGDLAARIPDGRIEELDEALSRLAAEKPELAELVQLHVFGGQTLSDAASSAYLSRPASPHAATPTPKQTPPANTPPSRNGLTCKWA